jgi:hypothetical protein
MPIEFQTEYLLSAQRRGTQDLHTVIVYRTEREFDDEGDEIALRRLWVAARGAEGMGVFGAHSAVVRFDEHGTPTSIVRCQQAHPDMGDFIQYAEDYELGDIDISADEHSILLQLWSKIDDELVDYEPEPADDPDGPLRFRSRIQIPKKQDAVMSEGWDPDGLIEPVTEGWQLFLGFS